MRLYHGTSSRHLEQILKEGLAPRAERASNWEAESCNEVVYLTKTYGLYFAANAIIAEGEELIIVEIDTDLLPDKDKLLSDEDAIWFAWKAGVIKPHQVEAWIYDETKERQAQYFAGFLEDFTSMGCTWDWSLRALGNCTYMGTIPPSAITRIISYKADGGWWLAFHDPTITPQNFRFCGPEYEATQLVIADRFNEALDIQMPFPMTLGLEKIDEMCRAHRTGLQTFEAKSEFTA